MRGWSRLILCVGLAVLVAGCPKGKQDYEQGRKAETLKDFDAAYDFYQKALQAEPDNADYQIKFNQARFQAGAFHGQTPALPPSETRASRMAGGRQPLIAFWGRIN